LSTAPREVHQPRRAGATQAAARGTAAFGPLYTEHFDGLYDFVVRIVRDHDLAGEVVQATFTKAWNELRDGHELTYPKSWLYAVARNHALDEMRRRRRLTDEPLAYAEPDTSRLSDPQEVVEANEIVELVWDSAAALNPDEYSLLDLHVRHGFGPAELADALDLERGAVYTRLSRLRRSLETSVASTLLVRRGRSECGDLAAIVEEHGGEGALTPELSRAIQAHVEECDVCSKAKRRSVSTVALFGALTPIAPIGPAREGILAAIVPDGGHAAGAATAGAAAGAVGATRLGSKARYLLIGAGGVAATAAIVAVALSNGAKITDPERATSVDHATGVASTDRTVTMRWSPAKDATGYSVMFSRNRNAEPPARENVTGTQYTSPPLGAGRWWFILRTHGKHGGWTDTLRRGPFVIVIPTALVPPPKAAAKKPARHKRVRKARHHAPPRLAASSPKQLALDFHASAPPRSQPAPKPKAAPKTKRKPKPKPPKPAKPPPTPAPTPPATSEPALPAPPAAQPVTPAPPVEVNDDDEHGEHEDEDDDDQGEDHDDGGEGHGHGHGHGHDD
jgi:RNA polymerase sigma factor (sigma-70 family)